MTPDQHMTVNRLGGSIWAKFDVLEDGAIYVPDLDVTIDRWGDVVPQGRLVGGAV